MTLQEQAGKPVTSQSPSAYGWSSPQAVKVLMAAMQVLYIYYLI